MCLRPTWRAKTSLAKPSRHGRPPPSPDNVYKKPRRRHPLSVSKRMCCAVPRRGLNQEPGEANRCGVRLYCAAKHSWRQVEDDLEHHAHSRGHRFCLAVLGARVTSVLAGTVDQRAAGMTKGWTRELHGTARLPWAMTAKTPGELAHLRAFRAHVHAYHDLNASSHFKVTILRASVLSADGVFMYTFTYSTIRAHMLRECCAIMHYMWCLPSTCRGGTPAFQRARLWRR